jgi:hypothetical protein
MSTGEDKVKTDWERRLEEFGQQFMTMLPPDVVPVVAEAIAEGVRSGMAERGIREGAQAPDFTLPDALGRPVTLSALLARGPAVVAFYRGMW